jgi:hypothetical protein
MAIFSLFLVGQLLTGQQERIVNSWRTERLRVSLYDPGSDQRRMSYANDNDMAPAALPRDRT